MNWQDEAIILAATRFNESSLKLELLTREHGRFAGIVRGGASSKRKAQFDMGNIIQAHWRARLSEQLGSFTTELIAQPAATILHDVLALSALNSAIALVLQCIPERHAERELYESLIHFLKHLHNDRAGFMQYYVHFEITLLSAAGFPLDLNSCVATGSIDNLCYVSPKSARAVSREAGLPYHDKMLKLPEFLAYPERMILPIPASQMIEALALTGFFLNHHAREITHKVLPESRARLLQLLDKQTNDISSPR